MVVSYYLFGSLNAPLVVVACRPHGGPGGATSSWTTAHRDSKNITSPRGTTAVVGTTPLCTEHIVWPVIVLLLPYSGYPRATALTLRYSFGSEINSCSNHKLRNQPSRTQKAHPSKLHQRMITKDTSRSSVQFPNACSPDYSLS